MSRTTVAAVRQELDDEDVTDQQFTDAQIETYMRRANLLVNRSVPSEHIGPHLEDVETLLAAHFAYGRLSGETKGRRVTQAAEGAGRMSFEGSGDSAYGEKSPFWARAAELEPAIEVPNNWFEVL